MTTHALQSINAASLVNTNNATNFAGDYGSTVAPLNITGNYSCWPYPYNYPQWPTVHYYPVYVPTYYPTPTDHGPRIAELEGQVKVLREMLAAALTVRAPKPARQRRKSGA